MKPKTSKGAARAEAGIGQARQREVRPSPAKEGAVAAKKFSYGPWVLLGSTVVALLLFINKPIHVDDTLFLRAAQQIQKHPADFYGFDINWFRSPQRMSEVFENPPLASYYLAGSALLVGWGETGLHLAFLIPALAAVWGIYNLAKLHCSRPMLAAAVAVWTPAFLVSATTLMCDVMLVAFWVWAVVVFEKALTTNRLTLFLSSGVLMALAFLTKFSGLALLPLLVVYGWWRSRRAGLWLLSLLPPVLTAVGYEALTFHLYGHGHFLQASLYAVHEGTRMTLAGRCLVGLVFAGGCFLPLVFYTPMIYRPKWVIAGLGLVCLVTLALPHAGPFSPVMNANTGVNWWTAFEAAAFLVSGIYLLIIAGEESCRREPVSVLLSLWVVGVFIFAIAVNWTINARSFLPAVPALAILLVRRLDMVRNPPSVARCALPLGAAVVLTLLVARADYAVAASMREAAADACEKYKAPGRTIWFEGHWGFQYYMEAAGAKALNLQHPEVKPADVIVIPNTGNGVSRPAPSVAQPIDVLTYLPNELCSTMNPGGGACFYAASWGPLPYTFGHLKPDHYIVFKPVTPGP